MGAARRSPSEVASSSASLEASLQGRAGNSAKVAEICELQGAALRPQMTRSQLCSPMPLGYVLAHVRHAAMHCAVVHAYT
eukprot:1143281-Pelagomonas_calceolata.AAC.9